MSARRILPALAALMVLGFGALVVWIVDRSEQERAVAAERALVTARMGSLRARLEAGLNGRLYLSSALVSLVARDPELRPEEFGPMASRLLEGHEGIRSIQLARGGVVSHVYPLEGNASALGLSLLDHPTQGASARRVIEERRTVVAGPVELVQGGEAFICRTPIFLTDTATGEEGFWGFATLLIDTDTLYVESRLTRARETSASGPGVEVLLRGRDGLGAEGEPFYGDATVLTEDPVALEVTLPSGSWEISGIPVGGWRAALYTHELRIAGALLVLALVIAAFVFTNNVLRLREELQAHWEAELRLREQARALEQALVEVKTLTGLLPICSHCKQIRDDRGLWLRIERYIEDHSDATFTHGLCPACVEELYGADMAKSVARKLADPAAK